MHQVKILKHDLIYSPKAKIKQKRKQIRKLEMGKHHNETTMYNAYLYRGDSIAKLPVSATALTEVLRS